MPRRIVPEPHQRIAIGRAIRARREQLGKSRTLLAVEVGVSEQSIGNYEVGYRFPPLSVLLRIAAALDIDLAQLVKEPAA